MDAVSTESSTKKDLNRIRYKSFFSILVVVVFLSVTVLSISLTNEMDAETFTVQYDKVTYEFSTEGDGFFKITSGVMITKIINNGAELIDIPSTVTHNSTTYKVKGIGTYSYTGTGAETIIVPNTVDYVGGRSFNNCIGLKYITFESSKLVFGHIAGTNWQLTNPFIGISSIQNVTLNDSADYYFSNHAIIKKSDQRLISYVGDDLEYEVQYGVKSIGYEAFSNSVPKKIALSYSVETLDYGAFYRAYNLESISLPNVKSIGGNAFALTEIRNLTIPSSLQESYELGYMPSLQRINVDPANTVFWTDGHSLVNKDGDLLAFTTALEGSYTMPNKVKHIGSALYFSRLSEIILSEGLTSISQGIFSDNPQLKRIAFPSSLTMYGSGFLNGFKLYDAEAIELDFTFPAVSSSLAASMVAGKTYSGDDVNFLYEEVPCKIVYDVNGGSSPMPAGSALLNRSFTIPSYTGKVPGYYFDGWMQGDRLYKAGDTFVVKSKTVNMVASWQPLPFRSVSYDLDGGSGFISPQSVQQESEFTVKHYDGIKQDYLFQGWDYEGWTYAEGDTIIMGDHDIVLKANWKLKPSHSVIYNVNGRSDVVPSQTLIEDRTFFLNECSGVGFGERFNGWSYNGVIYPAGSSFTMGHQDMVFTALIEVDLSFYLFLIFGVLAVIAAISALVILNRRKKSI